MPHSSTKLMYVRTGVMNKCPLCDKCYSSHFGFKLHFKKSHPEDELGKNSEAFSCRYCGVVFENDFQRRRHRKVFYQGM